MKVEQSNWASNGNDSFGSTNISKPGFNHNVSATITGTDSNNFTHKVENGHLSTNLDFSKLENNENSVTIKYDVTYSPDWSGVDLPDNVHFDKKMIILGLVLSPPINSSLKLSTVSLNRLNYHKLLPIP